MAAPGETHWCLPLCHGHSSDDFDWFAQSPKSHHPASRLLPEAEQSIERRRTGEHLLRHSRFETPCAKDALNLCVHLETPESARRLVPETDRLVSGMHDLESMYLDTFIDKVYGDDLLLLTATEGPNGRLLGMVFWRYLRKADDLFWRSAGVDWRATLGPHVERARLGGQPFNDAWVVIELLCTDEAYRGHGVGKLLLVAALAYSAVKDGKTTAVLSLGGGEENVAARELYERLGFREMPAEAFTHESTLGGVRVLPKYVMVAWDIKRGLKSLTLGDISGEARGTHVPQLETGSPLADGPADVDAPKRLDSATYVEVVERLTAPGPAKDPSDMTVAELRQVITEAGLTFRDCFEKQDLVARAREALAACETRS